MDLGLDKKVVVISGGAKGIGRAIALGVAAEGGIPVIVDPSLAEGAELVRDISGRGQDALHIPVRLTSPEVCESVITQAVAQFSRIDAVVNNAGTNDGVGLEHGSPVRFRDSVLHNLCHYYDLVHFALPSLIKFQGSIVNIASKVATTGQGGTSGYAASKGAQLALTREWAVELLPYKIRVNAVIPAEVMTPLYQKWLQSSDDPIAKQSHIEGLVPLEARMSRAEEVADMVVFLLSARATHITGQWMFVDGGYVHLDRAITAAQ